MNHPIDKTMSSEIEKQILLGATPSRVWQALIDHKQFGEWFRVSIETPFALGKTARGKILHPGYENVTWEVNVEKIEFERVFAFSWHPYAVDRNVDYSSEAPTVVEFRLEKSGGGTRLTVTESGFENVPDHRRDEAFRMNESGWLQQLQNVEAYLAKNG